MLNPINIVKDFFQHWNTPKQGDYVPNKEFASYAVGGMGVQGFYILMLYTALSSGARLAVVYGFSPTAIYYTGLGVSILTLLISPLRSMIIDNMRSKRGKFRPYLFWLGPPCLLLFWSLAFVPGWIAGGITDAEAAKTVALIVYQIIFFLANTLIGFYTMGMNSLIQVITPNGIEREKIQSIGALFYSIGPSIIQLFFPMIANLVYGDGAWEVLGTYQWIFPIFGLVFMLLGYICYFGTKERLVVEKAYVAKVKFLTGLKEVIKNKYFWIINVSTILGFARLMIVGTTYYICVHMLKSTAIEGIVTTIIATGSIPAMLFGPLLLKKLDKKIWIILSYFFTATVSAVMLIIAYVGFGWGATPYVFIVLTYLNTLLQAINVVTTPLVTAEYMDYTQLKTGKRLDGFMGQVGGMMVTAVGMGTGYIIPIMLEAGGLINGDEFSDPDIGMTVLRNAFIVWGWAAVISGVLAAIPYFFYDLNSEKHKNIIRELKKIALSKDLAAGSLKETDYAEALELGVVTQEDLQTLSPQAAMLAEGQPDGLEIQVDDRTEQ